MTDLPVSRATRFTQPRWLDGRVAVGALLVLASVAVGAHVVGGAERADRVWVAAAPLSPGEHLAAADLLAAPARLFGHTGAYLAATAAPPVGYVVVRPVSRGELVPADALAPAAAAAETRLVTVAVTTGHFPADLARGDRVDVYVSPAGRGGTAAPAPPQLVLAAATVEERDSGGGQFAAPSSATSVELSVPAAEVAQVLAGTDGGTVDLVRVPAGSEAS